MSISVGHVVSGDLWAGAEAQVLQLVQQLRALGAAPRVAMFSADETARRFQAEGFEVACFDEQIMGSAAIASSIRGWARDAKFDVVHTHGYKEHILSAWALRGLDVKLVRTMHGLPHAPTAARNLRRRVMHLMDMLAVRWAAEAMIAVSHDLAEHLHSQIGSTILRTIPNGVAVPPKRERNMAHPPRIAFFGRLVPVKAVDRLIRAMPLIIKALPTAECWIVGDGPERAHLESLADGLDVSHAVRFHGFCKDIPSLIAQVDAVALTSEHEGMPMIALEAGAHATALLAPSVGGLPDVVEDGVTGVLLDSTTPDAIAEAAIRMLRDRESTARMGAAAYDRITAHYSAAQTAEATLSLYKDVLSTDATRVKATVSA